MQDDTARRVAIILRAAATEFEISVEELLGKAPSREDSARALAKAALSAYTELSWRGVGRAMGRQQIFPSRKQPWLSDKLDRVAERLIEAGLPPVSSAAKGLEIEAVLDMVCDRFKIDRENLSDRQRTQTATKARMTAIHALHILSRLSTVHIGDILNRDHSTVIHHLRQGPKFPWLAPMLREMEKQLRVHVPPEQDTAISTAA
jgi:chromosomal replication initiation ATPase DnaA